MSLLTTNAELQKGIWLELNLLRLALVPAMTMIIGLILHRLDGDDLITITAYGYVLFGTLAGVYGIGKHVSEEARSGTWELQRMYPVSAWHMVWGKLLGLGSYAWYGAIVVLVMGSVFALLRQATLTPISLVWFLGLTGAILLLHAVSLLIAMVNGDSRNNRNVSILVIALLVPLVAWPIAGARGDELLGHWWGLPMDPLLATLLIYVWLGWALLGCVTTMDRHMGSERGPWVWLAFTLFLILFVAGFGANPARSTQFGFMTLLVVTYGGLISHTATTMQIRRLHHLLVSGDLTQLGTEMPRWAYGIAALLILGPLVALFQWVPADYRVIAAAYPVALMRDAFVLSALGLQQQRIPSTGQISAYILLVYLVFPLLLTALGGEFLFQLFIPGSKPIWGWLFIVIEAAVALVFWAHTCRTRFRDQG